MIWKTVLALVVLVMSWGIACGDLDELDEEALRQLVRQVRDATRTELAKDNSAEEIDRAEQKIVDTLRNGESTDTDPPSSTVGDYRISPANLGRRHPGFFFSVSIEAGEGDPAPSTLDKSLSLYNSKGEAVPATLGQWKERIGDNVYDIASAAGDSATFPNIFLMATSLNANITHLGGRIGNVQLRRATIEPEGLAYIATFVLVVLKEENGVSFTLGGPAKRTFVDAGSVLNFVALNAEGDVVANTANSRMSLVDVPYAGAIEVLAEGATCVVGSPVLLRMGNNSSVFETDCRGELPY